MNPVKNFLLKHQYAVIYFLLLALVLIDRWILLEHFTFKFVDDDQSIMWFGAKEFAAGRFHEPYFFGQNYNTMFESLVAVPFVYLGVSYPIALTWVMSLLTLFPYILISTLLFRRKKEIQALVFLSIPLLLPNEFGMITAISRGCVTGVFIASFAIITLYSQSPKRFLSFGFFSVLALFATPSAIVVLFPVGIWLLAENFRNRIFYFHTIIGAIPAAMIWFLSNRFYVIHPEYIVHHSWPLDFSLARIKPYNWNDLFNFVIPIFWRIGCVVFALLIAIGLVLLRQRERQAAIGIFAGALFLFFTLTINKVHDGYSTVFYSYGRMFIALPLFIAVFLSKIHLSKVPSRIFPFFLLLPISFSIIKCSTISKDVHREIVEKPEHNMQVSEISSLNTLCDTLSSVSKKYNVDLIVIGFHPTKHLINYGCPCLKSEFPQTIEPSDDRRTWVLKNEDNKTRKNILFAGFYEDSFAEQLALNNQLTKVCNDPLIYILRDNGLPTKTLLASLYLPIRPH